jgi:serine/threonine protein kinase
MVTDYMNRGNLREYLEQRGKELSFKDRLEILQSNAATSLKVIGWSRLTHRDLHSGNILLDDYKSLASDLGFSQPASYQKEEGKIFGVFPYVAPEVLQGGPYTQASDIYSFGIIMYEVFANAYPYADQDQSTETSKDLLIEKICKQGLRPSIDEVPIPQLLKDLIKNC